MTPHISMFEDKNQSCCIYFIWHRLVLTQYVQPRQGSEELLHHQIFTKKTKSSFCRKNATFFFWDSIHKQLVLVILDQNQNILFKNCEKSRVGLLIQQKSRSYSAFLNTDFSIYHFISILISTASFATLGCANHQPDRKQKWMR